MGSIVGFTVFTLVAYIVFVLKIPWLVIPVTLLSLIILWRPFLKELKKIRIQFNRQTIIILVVFVVGIAGQLAVISPSGRIVGGDLLFGVRTAMTECGI